MSGKYCLYKNKSAVRFNLIPGTFRTFTDKSGKERITLADEGSIMMELAEGTGKTADGNNAYDWENKIMFNIGIADLALLMENPFGSLTHVHEKGSVTTTKVVSFQKMEAREGSSPKVWLGYMAKVKDDESKNRKLGIALTVGEHKVLLELLKASIPIMQGWTGNPHVANSR